MARPTTPTTEITVPRPRFDRAAPVPERTLHAVLATGVGQAPTRRLLRALLGGALCAVAVLLLAPEWWVAATPFLCLTALSGWGLASKRLLILTLNAQSPPRPRTVLVLRVLRVLRAAMAVLGIAAALAGVAGFVRLLLRPWAL
jgi:hypothetical protein